MKSINTYRDLEQYGLISLTGEADPYSMRTLFDITPDGQKVIEDFLSAGLLPPPNWNHRQGQTGSILLSQGLIKDLCKFILYHVEKAECVLISPDGTMSTLNEEEANKYRALDKNYGYEIYTNWNQEPGKNRNEHQFTGRTT